MNPHTPRGRVADHLRRTARIDRTERTPRLVMTRDRELRIEHINVYCPDPWLPLWVAVPGTIIIGRIA